IRPGHREPPVVDDVAAVLRRERRRAGPVHIHDRDELRPGVRRGARRPPPADQAAADHGDAEAPAHGDHLFPHRRILSDQRLLPGRHHCHPCPRSRGTIRLNVNRSPRSSSCRRSGHSHQRSHGAETRRPLIPSARSERRKTAARAGSSTGTPPASSSRRVRSRYSAPARSPAFNVSACILVATNPGASALTAIPYASNSSASVSTSRTTAALLHAYAVQFGNGDVAPPPDTRTSRPPRPEARSDRPIARATRNVPKRSIRTVSNHSAGSTSSAGPIGPRTAAAWTRPSIPLRTSAASPTSASTSDSRPTSAATAWTRPPPYVSESRAAAASSGPRLLAAITTRAPAASASDAHAYPRPWLPPLIRIPRPVRTALPASSPASPAHSTGAAAPSPPGRDRMRRGRACSREVQDDLRPPRGEPVPKSRHPPRRHEALEALVPVRYVEHEEPASARAGDLPAQY